MLSVSSGEKPLPTTLAPSRNVQSKIRTTTSLLYYIFAIYTKRSVFLDYIFKVGYTDASKSGG